jgi:hypothetical protein
MRPILLSFLLIAAMGAETNQLNLPPGQYPGKPAESYVPAVRSDNHPILTPGESRVVTTEVAEADARGERLAIAVEGFNVAAGR